MTNPAGHPPSPGLHISRVPGGEGPIVRCTGELTVVTAEALRRELGLLISLSPPALILNLAGCERLDADGVMLLLDIGKQLYAAGRRFIVVAGTGTAAHVLCALGADAVIPLFPTEGSAALALRGGGPSETAPAKWSDAHRETLARWRSILTALQNEPADEVMRQITSSHGLCQRAEAIRQGRNAPEESRCSSCPLFQELGARTEDIGCRSITQPMLEALLAGDRGAAQMQAARLIELIERMPVSEGEADAS